MALVLLVLGVLGILAFVLWISILAALWLLGITALVILGVSAAVGQQFGQGAGWTVGVLLTLAALALLGAWGGDGDTSA